MRKAQNFSLAVITGIFLVISGCHGNPATPSIFEDTGISQLKAQDAYQSHQCLGYYALAFDMRNYEINMQPARSADLHANLTGIMDGTMGIKVVGVPSEYDPPNGIYVFDITLKHPFATKPQFTGFDVKGILITPGSNDDTGLYVFANPDETCLLNADGFTRWWNPLEFTVPGIFGYIHGKLANTDYSQLTATINPYKCFADVLKADDSFDKIYSVPMDDDLGRGVFRAGSSNTRRYRIKFPMNPGPIVKFGYAIDSSWKIPDVNPPVEIPDDFSIEANQPEAYSLLGDHAINTLYYDTETGNHGGALWVYADVRDWQGEEAGNTSGQVEAVKLWCPALFSGSINMGMVNGEPQIAAFYKKLETELNPTAPGDYLIAWQAISKNGPIYKQGSQPGPIDDVAAWRVGKVTVTDPECEVDNNNDSTTAGIMSVYGPVTGSLCFTDDPTDWYRLDINAGKQASGKIRFVHNAGTQSLSMFNSELIPVGSASANNGYSEISFNEPTPLYAGTYYVEVKEVADEGAFLYLLEPQLTLTDITPAPTQVETRFLDCDAQWIKMLEDNFTILAGYAGTWVMYTNEIVPYAVSRTYDTIGTTPAYSDSHMYYWENADDNPVGIDMIDFTALTVPVHYEDVITIPNTVEAVAMNSQNLFVAVDIGSKTVIRIYDWASDPANPQLISSINAYEKDISQMALVDPEGSETTLVAITYHLTSLYDVEDPYNPHLGDAQPNSVTYNSSMSVSRTLSSGRAFVAVTSFDLDGLGYLTVYQYDTSSHDFPIWGKIDLPGSAGNVMVKGVIVYVGDGDGITIIDISTNNDFHNTGTTDTFSGTGAMDYLVNELQAINYDAGYSIFNNSDPYNPVETKRPVFLNNPREGSVYGDYGYFVETIGFNAMGALKVVDINPPEYADVEREYLLYGTPTKLFRESGMLVVGSASPGHIWLFDTSSQPDCDLVYNKGFSVGVTDVCIAGIAMYVTTGDKKLHVFDISAFPAVVQQADVTLPDVASKIVHKGYWLYISQQGSDDIWMYSIIDMNNPSYEGTYNVGWQIRDMVIDDYFWQKYLYVATADRFVVLDVTSQDNPIQKCAIQIPYELAYMDVDQQLAYVCGYSDGPSVASVFPPNNAKFLSVDFPVSPGYNNLGLFINDGYLFLMQPAIGFNVYDLYP